MRNWFIASVGALLLAVPASRARGEYPTCCTGGSCSAGASMQEAKAELEKASAAVAQHAKALELARAALASAKAKVKKAAEAGTKQVKAVGCCPACDACTGVAGKLDAILKRLDQIEQRLGALEARGAYLTTPYSYPQVAPTPLAHYGPVQQPTMPVAPTTSTAVPDPTSTGTPSALPPR